MKYEPLGSYLSNLSKSTNELTLKFREIEAILDAKLPMSASTYREWWANQASGSQAQSWLGVGFVVDSVDLNRKLVYFCRDFTSRAKANSGGRKSKGIAAVKVSTAKPASENVLRRAGFKRVGEWTLSDDGIQLTGNISDEPSVYAHVVDGGVYYVGSTTMGLKKRMYFYERPGKGQKTNLRINPLIADQLRSGKKVWLLAANPGQSTWNRLPVDLVPGLEAGLLKKLNLPWNIRGR